MSDEQKIELFDAFTAGSLRVLVTKPKIGAFGLNWQHCANLSMFPSHSYEQYYQAVRRCWRYGQTRDVTVHVITTQGEADVLGNLQRKAEAADQMFAFMAAAMAEESYAAH
jgi:SNF2 family DNA or RNA helicase